MESLRTRKKNEKYYILTKSMTKILATLTLGIGVVTVRFNGRGGQFLGRDFVTNLDPVSNWGLNSAGGVSPNDECTRTVQKSFHISIR